jgi:hypothetical protein
VHMHEVALLAQTHLYTVTQFNNQTSGTVSNLQTSQYRRVTYSTNTQQVKDSEYVYTELVLPHPF